MFRTRLIISAIIIGGFWILGCIGSGLAKVVEPVVETYNRNNLIRLHVVAASNFTQDQELKLKVRDQILKVIEPLLLKVEDPREAERIINDNIPLVKKIAEQLIKDSNRDLTVKVSLEQSSFPEVAYPFGVLPAGEYKGLKVILGPGEGRNWWCVLYPPLCLLEPNAPSFIGKQKGQVQVEYKLAILEELVKHKNLSLNEFWKGWGRFFKLL